MLRRVLTVLGAGFMAALMASCGQTYKLDSIAVTPAAGYNLTNTVTAGQLTVTATYSNSKTNVVTLNSTYNVGESALNSSTAPLSVNSVPVLTINKSGLVTASGTAVACTWVLDTSSVYEPKPYPVTATYTEDGVTVQDIVNINVATAPGCDGL
jgi:hypothetical protein